MSIFEQGYDKLLSRQQDEGSLDTPSYEGVISDPVSSLGSYQGGLSNQTEDVISTQNVSSGATSAITWIGKTTFTDTTVGKREGVDNDGTYKWIIGSGTSSVDWNVTTANTLTVKGTLSATTGTIGGWTINATTLTGGNATLDSTGALSIGTGDNIFKADSNGIYLGNATYASAPFRVSMTGALVSTSATITGAITATSGTIGSFTIGTYLYTGTKTAWNDANAGVHLGSDGIGIGNNVFTVNGSTGALVATSATITGAITATSGSFTGTINATAGKFGTSTNYWSVGATGLTATSASTDVIINYGKTDFDNTQVGFILGYDFSDLLPKFYIGTTTAYLNFTGAAFNLRGTTIDYPTITNLVAGTEISIQGWQNTCLFSSTDYNTVAWATGSLTLLDGTAYTISAGNTGNITALTYIYLNIAVSTTVLQTTTTAATAVGTGKILIAVASPNADTTSKATFQAFGGSGGQLLTVDSIAANSASVNEFISNTAQIKDAVITSAKVVSLVADKLTAGVGLINSLSVLSTLTMGSAATDGYIQSYGWNGTVAGFQLKGGATPAFTLIGGTITGGIFQTAASGARTVFNTSGIQGYDATTQRYNLGNDGSGWLGASTTLAWTTAGAVSFSGFTAAASTLTATNLLIDAGNQKITLGSGNDILISDAADATYRFGVGNSTLASCPFRITKGGAVTATDITITAKAGSNIWPTMSIVGYFSTMDNTTYSTKQVTLNNPESASADLAVLGYTSTSTLYRVARWKQLSTTATSAISLYNSHAGGGSAASVQGVIKIGSYFYVSYTAAGPTPSMVRLNDDCTTPTGITLSGGDYAGSLAWDQANSYLCVLDNTTQIRRYTISGTTATYNSLVTLDTAVDNASPCFMYDGTYFYGYDTTNGLMRKFNSSGVQQSTLDIGETTSGLFKGLVKIQGILYIVCESPEIMANNGYIKQQYIINLVSINNF